MKQLNQLTSDQNRHRTLHFKEMTVYGTLENQERIAIVQLREPITAFGSRNPHIVLTSDIIRIHLESLDDNVWIDEDAKIITGYFAFDVSKPSTNRSSMIYLVTTSFAEQQRILVANKRKDLLHDASIETFLRGLEPIEREKYIKRQKVKLTKELNALQDEIENLNSAILDAKFQHDRLLTKCAAKEESLVEIIKQLDKL